MPWGAGIDVDYALYLLSDGGQVVINPSGGLLSKGHPLGATGLAQCYELTHQLRATALLFARMGAKVVIGDMTAEAGHGVVQEIADLGGEALFLLRIKLRGSRS